MKKHLFICLLLFVSILSFSQQRTEDLPATLQSRLSRTQAEFPGGPEKMKKFFDKHKRYQNKDHEKFGVGIVYVGFIVETDGSIDSVTVIQPLSEYYDHEALRLIKTMPKWKPATQDGQPLRTKFRFPVKF